jgi:tetratricopeptide (TPR) repeat protein
VLGGKRASGGRDVVVLFDASGSRGKLDLAVQRETLGRLLGELDDSDRAQVIALNTRARVWPHGWRPARKSGAEAQAFIDTVRAIGGTDLGAGLSEAGRLLDKDSRGLVVYLGDGVATLGEKDSSKLAALLPSGTAFVGIGTGKKVDAPLLESVAGSTGGTCTFMNSDEPIAWRVFDLVAALATPRLVNLGVSAVDSNGRTVEGSVQLSRTVAADGEEIRVVGRFEKETPTRLVLTGKLAGVAYETSLSLAGARADALYLPRLWARGRVEQLLREGGEKNKAEIVALGKENFIATPFTSLLVLENDEMYAQMKVERGKPDPFAFYKTPEKIEVVTEPFPGQTTTPGHYKNMRELLESVARRQWGLVYSPYGYIGDYELSSGGTGIVFRESDKELDYGMLAELDNTRIVESVIGSGARQRYFFPVNAGFDTSEFLWFGLPNPALSGTTGDRYFASNQTGVIFYPTGLHLTYAGAATRFLDNANSNLEDMLENEYVHPEFDVIHSLEAKNAWVYLRNFEDSKRWFPRRLTFFNYNDHPEAFSDFQSIDMLARGAYYWPGRTQTLNASVYWDLTLLVPSLHATRADILALAERELPHEPTPGHVDAASLALLDKARVVFGLRQIELADGNKGIVSGDGRLSLVRKLPWDLEEQVFVDGTEIQHVYRELGICVRRSLSRFHAAELSALMPFLPPSAAALAGWDVTASGRTVTLVPAGAKDPAYRVELDFAEDGRLSERRELRRQGGAWKVLLRVAIGVDFKLTVEAEGFKPHEVAVTCQPLAVTESPSFVPNLDGLVIVDAPARTREAQGTQDPIALVWAQHLDGRGVDHGVLRNLLGKDSRLGLRVLYASAGGHGTLHDYMKEETPLARYFGLFAEGNHAKRLEGLRAFVHDFPEGALATLARSLAAQDACEQAQQNWNDDSLRDRAVDAAAELMRSRFAVLVLEAARRVAGFGGPARSPKILALYERAGELSSEEGVQYEVAQAFHAQGLSSEAAKRFEYLYARAMERGVFPPFEYSLVQTLQQVKTGEETHFDAFVRRAISWAEETKNANALIVLASSLHQTNNTALVERALRRIEGTVPATARDALEAALARLWQSWGDPARAEAMVRDLLAKPALASHAWLHDYAGSLAEAQGKVAVAIDEHMRALELEVVKPDDVVNLSAYRERHARLVALCAQLASANAAPGVVQRALADRILRIADRWRELDDANPALDTEVARALLACGADDDAWDAASGAIERHPAEGAGYTAVAALYVAQGRLDFALGLYEQAAKVEPTDPTPLLEEARLLERKGEPDRARSFYERIMGKAWHERFANVLQEARAALAR